MALFEIPNYLHLEIFFSTTSKTVLKSLANFIASSTLKNKNYFVIRLPILNQYNAQ